MIQAVRAAVRAFLEPFLDTGTIHESFCEAVEEKATRKIMRKRANETSRAFLDRPKEREAVKRLTREYVRREVDGRNGSGRREKPPKVKPETSRGKRPESAFDFDVDDL